MSFGKLGRGFGKQGNASGQVAGQPVAIPGTAFDFAAGDAAPAMTRTASASYWNSASRLATAAPNVGRVTFDPFTGERLGLLIEDKTGENDIVQSNALDNAVWNKANATVTANTSEVLDPAGANAADILFETAASGNHGVTKVVTITAPATDITVTEYFILKARDRSRVVLIGNGKSSVQLVANLLTGEIDPQFTTVSANLIDARARLLVDGWVEVAISFVVAAGATTYQAILRLVELTTAQNTSYTGDVTKGIYFYHAQSRNGLVHDNPIFTAASIATRDQDVSNVAMASWWNATSTTLFFEGRSQRYAGQCIVAQADDGTENNRVRLWRDASGSGRLLVTTAGVDQLNVDLGAWQNGTDRAIAVAFGVGAVRISMNGGAVASYALASPPAALTTLRDGLDSTGAGPTMVVRRKAAYASALPDGQLQSKSLKRQSGSLWCPGDSFTAGQVTGQTFSDSYPSRLGRSLSRRYFNAGIGGQTSSQILTRVQADIDHLNWIALFEAGRNDGTGNPTLLYSNIAAMVACLPLNGRSLVWSVPYALNDAQATKDAIAAMNAQLLATYGNRFINIDWSTVTRVSDQLHPDDAGLAAMAAAAQAVIVSLGW